MLGPVPALPAGMDPRMMMMGMNGPVVHGGMHPGMRGPYPGVSGPGAFPGGPMGPRMMMGPNGPVPMGGGPVPMGYHPLPPNHPVMMEMQALHQHLQQMCAQPQNPANQQKVSSVIGF
jgi:hypothetical protein